MRVALSIVVAGILIAVAILIAFRWQITAATSVVYRLDRWTGTVTLCDIRDIYRIDCGSIPFGK